MDKLLPCPFCGGEAEVHSEDTPVKKGEGHYNYDFVAVFQVHCVKCKFVCSNFFETKELAIKAWNTRALKPLDEGEIRNLVYSRDSLGTKLYEKPEELIKEFCSQFGVQGKGGNDG